MINIKNYILEKLHLNKEIENKELNFDTSEEVANFFRDCIDDVKVNKVLDHGFSSAVFKNWTQSGAGVNVGDVYMVEFPDRKFKLRIGMCRMVKNINSREDASKQDFSGINKGDICFQTAVKTSTNSGKTTFSWNADALTGYEPGTSFNNYLKNSYQSNTFKKIINDYKLIQ